MYKNLANITKGAYAKAFNQKFVSNLYQKIQNQKDIRYIITYKSNVKSTLKDRYIDIELKLHHLGTSGVADSGYFID